VYILFTGAPGSKWSSVVKNIYWSEDIDHSDYSEARTYYHDADTPGNKHLMHIGAYWDPGMEFDNTDWDGPFSGTGIRIVKSHTFAYGLDEFKGKHPIVIVYRNDVECLEWWKLCGEFSITYPLYNDYYKNLDYMWQEIQKQNQSIMQFVKSNYTQLQRPNNNKELCAMLSLQEPKDCKLQDYTEKDIKVYVYK